MNELITTEGNAIEYAMVAWLHAKTTRTGSEKTKRAYEDTISRFRAALQRVGLDLDSDPARVADVAQVWAGVPWDATRKQVTPNTYNQRLAIVSSFYSFAFKRRILKGENPLGMVDRKPVQGYAGARALDAQTVSEAMGNISRDTLSGMRDYALLAVALFTGRRLSELVNIRWGDIQWDGGHATVTFPRAKGGKQMVDTLPLPLSNALLEYVRAVHGDNPGDDVVLWVSLAHNCFGAPLGKQSVADIYMRHLGTSKVHSSRHTFAHGMEAVGAKLSDIQARLGHANAATTSTYLAALGRAENEHGGALAALFGLSE